MSFKCNVFQETKWNFLNRYTFLFQSKTVTFFWIRIQPSLGCGTVALCTYLRFNANCWDSCLDGFRLLLYSFAFLDRYFFEGNIKGFKRLNFRLFKSKNVGLFDLLFGRGKTSSNDGFENYPPRSFSFNAQNRLGFSPLLCLSYCFLKNFLREFRFLFDFLIRWEHLNLRTLKNWSKADFRKNFVFD